jgi:hypothetical protein
MEMAKRSLGNSLSELSKESRTCCFSFLSPKLALLEDVNRSLQCLKTEKEIALSGISSHPYTPGFIAANVWGRWKPQD